jgi:hypothetical protein
MQLEIDIDKLTVGDLEALEDVKRVKEIVAWLTAHAGADAAELRALPLKELKDVLRQVQERIGGALALPKANGASSSSG